MTIVNFPTEKMKALSDENYRLRRELLIASQRLSGVNQRNAMLERELHAKSFDMSCIPPIAMPKQVAEWIEEYRVPWESLYCTDCKSWIKELDSLFPYHWERNECNCEGGENG